MNELANQPDSLPVEKKQKKEAAEVDAGSSRRDRKIPKAGKGAARDVGVKR